MMNKYKSNHKYEFSVGTHSDYEEFIVEMSVDTDPARPKKWITLFKDMPPMELSNAAYIGMLQMEEGRDKVKIELDARAKELNLYLDEFIEALQHAKELLLK